jgi:parallel beta-helix repeat protein
METMKAILITRSTSIILLLSTLNAEFANAFAQGSLTPPGAPGPTMKTLSQIEPRTPISSLPYTISAPGAYYVTTNLTGVSGTNGITIAANDVTLDLKGYSLVGVPSSIEGVVVSGNRTNLWIGNGNIRGWGVDGLDAGNAQSAVFADLNVIGCGNTGFRPGTASVITRCTASANTQEGFLALDGCVFSQCSANYNGAAGISTGNNCRLTDCRAQFNNYDGIAAGLACTISGCTSANNTNSGISCSFGGSISDCTAEGNLNRGIDAGASSSVVHCSVVGIDYGVATGHYGILVGDTSVVKDCISRNNVSGGIDVAGIRAGTNCILSGCAATTNSPFGISAGANCVVTGCSASWNVASVATGISAGQSSMVRDCNANGNYVGISVTALYTTVEGCVVSGNRSEGILISANGCLILNNTCDNNGSGALVNGGITGLSISNGRIEANHFSNNSHNGLYLDSASVHNVIARNVAVTNIVQTTSYNLSTANNDFGPMGRAATATSPWANLQY